jgi:hypothetical protein
MFYVPNWINVGPPEQFSMDQKNARIVYEGVIVIVNHDSNALR